MNVKIPNSATSITNRTQLALDKLQRIASRWLTNDELNLVTRSNRQSSINCDAALFHVLYKEFGVTPQQIIEIFNKYQSIYAMIDYSFTASVEDIPEVELLKDVGVDLYAMYEEHGL